MDLFSMGMENNLKKTAPLAQRMRPRNLQEFAGQEHILAPGKYLYRVIKSKILPSMIFYGPPGVGKTTLAEIIAEMSSKNFHRLSAVTSNLKELREVLEECQRDLELSARGSILFLDEIHRFNKTQQDALLPYVEKGIVILIGATTENPYFEVNKALLSRCKIINLKELGKEDLIKILNTALEDKDRGLGRYQVEIDESAKEFLISRSSGDGRYLLNSLELAVLSTDKSEDGTIKIGIDDLKNSFEDRKLSYDKQGNDHYNIISAFIKSMRGSDPDAALIYLATMLESGEDPKFILRRMIIFASEDIGNANPQALQVAVDAFRAFEIVGMPEGRLILGHACTYLSSSPKSNASYLAINKAIQAVLEKTFTIPAHIRDPRDPATDKDLRKDYKYPHDYPGAYVDQVYMPDEFAGRKFYEPKDQGQEVIISEYLKKLNK